MLFFMRPMFLVKRFNILIQRILEFGFADYFERKTNRILGTDNYFNSKASRTNFEIFTMAEISLSLYIYFIGIGFSVFGFIIEILIYHCIVII